MPQILSAAVFLPADLPKVASFGCGSLSWQTVLADWIRNPQSKRFSNSQHDTEIWLYHHFDGNVVGFGSLGTTRWSDPYPSGPKMVMAYIPAMAIQKQYWGMPINDPPKFSRQIMEDLIAKANQLGPPLLALRVHERNVAARKLYGALRFLDVPGAIEREYIRMVRRLR